LSINKHNNYDADQHIGEWYDDIEHSANDVEQIRRLLAGRGPLHILEPFCGTGRILILLAEDGHHLVGLDQSSVLLAWARAKTSGLLDETQSRIELIEADVTECEWPQEFDIVVLGGNSLYELATLEEQEGCIASAAVSLKPGGYVYIDNDHMEGELDESWTKPGVRKMVDWTGSDGTRLDGTMETIWYDAPARLWRGRRVLTATSPDGVTTSKEWIQQKHPVSAIEVKQWLEAHEFVIEKLYGGHDDIPYDDFCGRATFWARKL
jgi:SAM-dependent methyltransferase